MTGRGRGRHRNSTEHSNNLIEGMMAEQLTPEDLELLQDIIEEYISDLRMEIQETDSYDFRQGLKQKKEALKRILRTLRSGSTTLLA
ncbi:MAG: hypothetical protein KAJ12_14215 [Bacteroidetes bacterium]|nr:hypothetical protein [Bacteroidota bacterium]